MSEATDLAALASFRQLLPFIQQYLEQQALPAAYPGLASWIRRFLIDKPLGPTAVLPLASCAAVGGDPRQAIAASAVCELLHLGVRALDDLQDQDAPRGLWTEIGPARAFNYSASLYVLAHYVLTHANFPARLRQNIQRAMSEEVMQLAAGQERDLTHQTETIEDYWQTIAAKNGRLFSLVCWLGALCGTGQQRYIDACRQYGFHLGIILQLFDDFEGTWAANDLEMGRITLPVLYGLNIDHPRRDELQALKQAGQIHTNADLVRTILDQIETRSFIIWVALQERDRALAKLQDCPGAAGVATLTSYVDVIFADAEQLLTTKPSA